MSKRPLPDLLERVAPDVVARFSQGAPAEAAVGAPANPEQQRDALRDYLGEVVTALRDNPEAPRIGEGTKRSWHGGAGAGDLVRANGALRRLILSEIERLGVTLSVDNMDRIASVLDAGLTADLGHIWQEGTGQLQSALEQAREATEAREQVLEVVSHDMKSPLMVVLGSAHLIRRELRQQNVVGRELVDTCLNRIKSASDTMNRLIGQLLFLARTGATRAPLEVSSVDSERLLERARHAALPLAEMKQVALGIRVERGTIRCDQDRALQVLANLVGNAIKFAGHGATVSISCARSTQEWMFRVEDTGPGIDRERIPMIFDRFWRSGAQAGSGLGLSIAKTIVELHGGRIWVESEVGVGTTFCFTFPDSAAAPL